MSRAGRIALWAAAGAAVLGGAFLLRATPLPEGRDNTLCIYRRATGMPCPGCGLTRSADAIAATDWRAAVRAHPLGPVLAAEALVGWLLWGLWATGRTRPPRTSTVRAVLLANLALLVALWLGRAATGTLPW